jgi:drug/metabolite transporter (DMT)-like permease
VPPLAAVQAYLLFGETLVPVQFIGFALALGGVLLTRSAPIREAGRPTQLA